MKPSARQHDKRDGWYVITPVVATKLLDEQGDNRPLREQKSVRFAEAMRTGKWNPNGETIILDERGRMLDGQGRCRACQIAGVDFETYVVFSVPRKYFPSLNTGQNRNGADTLALVGTPSYVLAAAWARWQIAFDAPDMSPDKRYGRKASNQEILETVKKHKESLLATMEAANALVPGWRGAIKGILAPAILLYVYGELRRLAPDRADAFFLGVVTGTNLSAKSPMLVLRYRLQPTVAGNTGGGILRMALTIKAALAFLANRPISILKWLPGEGFPVLELER